MQKFTNEYNLTVKVQTWWNCHICVAHTYIVFHINTSEYYSNTVVLRSCNTWNSQRELYEKSIELNKFYIDTGLMNDRTLADFRLDLLPPLYELFENYQISKEETGEIISGYGRILST